MRDAETQMAARSLRLRQPQQSDDALDTSYYATRGALAAAVSEAAKYIVQHGLKDQTAPMMVRVIGLIAGRFAAPIAEKVAALSVLVV